MDQRSGSAREARVWLQTFVIAIVSLVLLFVFVGRPVMVDGDSMLPTLQDRELMLVRQAGYTPEAGDVVVLRKDFENVTGPIVKRVIAVGGQTVEIDYAAGTVAVDGTVLTEDYILEPMVQRSCRASPPSPFRRAVSLSWGTTATSPTIAGTRRWEQWRRHISWARRWRCFSPSKISVRFPEKRELSFCSAV